MNTLGTTDPIIAQLIHAQELQVAATINLIASENIASAAVREATGSILTDKYAEGYPGRRYYAGCTIVDRIEEVAIARAQELFGAEHANVQPHAGSTANMAVYTALLNPGDTILAMNLTAGGHLTHGHSINFSGRWYTIVAYGVDPIDHRIAYDTVEELAIKHKPKLIIAGASAYAREIDYARFATIAKKVGALLMVDMAHIAGLIAGGVIPSPIPHADVVTTTTHKTLRGPRGGLILCKQEYAQAIDKAVMPGIQGGPCMNSIAAKAVALHEAMQPFFARYAQQVVRNMQTLVQALQQLGHVIISDGSDTHLAVIDIRQFGISGRQAEERLESIGIIVNRNCIPFDPASPMLTSGIRIGTPSITSRGMQEKEMQQLAELIHQGILEEYPHDILQERVQKLVAQFPIPTTYDTERRHAT